MVSVSSLEFLLCQSVVDCFENQSPFVIAAGRLAIAARAVGLAPPDENSIQSLAR